MKIKIPETLQLFLVAFLFAIAALTVYLVHIPLTIIYLTFIIGMAGLIISALSSPPSIENTQSTLLWGALLLGFLFVTGISAVLSPRPQFSLEWAFVAYGFPIGIIFLFWQIAQKHSDWLVGILIGFGLYVTGNALLDIFQWANTWRKVGVWGLPKGAWRVSNGLWPNPNLVVYPLHVAFFFLLSWAFTEEKRHPWWRNIALQLTLALILLAGVFTGSRGGLIGFVVSMLLWGWIFRKKVAQTIRKRLGQKSIIWLSSGWALYSFFLLFILRWELQGRHNPFPELVKGVNNTTRIPLLDRAALWKAALTMWREHPFIGGGAGNFPLYLVHHFSVPPVQIYAHAHNIWFHTLAEEGLLGLGWWLGALGVTVYLLYRLHPFFSNLNWGAVIILWGWIAHGTVEACEFVYPQCLILLGMVWAIAFANISSNTPAHLQKPFARKTLWRLGLIGWWVIWFIIAWMSLIRAFPIEYRMTQGLQENSPSLLSEAALRSTSSYAYFQAGAIAARKEWETYLPPNFGGNYSKPESLQEAISLFRGAANYAPWNTYAWANLALLEWYAKEPRQAIADMKKAVQHAYQSGYFHLILGWMEESEGHTEDAIAEYQKALSFHPEWAHSLFFEKPSQARQHALASFPSAQIPLCQQAWEALAQEKWGTARQYLHYCDGGAYYTGMAVLGFYQDHWPTEKVKHWLAYGLLVGKSTLVLDKLQGDIYRRQGDCAHALAAYQRAFEQPLFPPAVVETGMMLYVYQRVPPLLLLPGGPNVVQAKAAQSLVQGYLQCKSSERRAH